MRIFFKKRILQRQEQAQHGLEMKRHASDALPFQCQLLNAQYGECLIQDPAVKSIHSQDFHPS